MMESCVIQKHVDNQNIVSYHRYVDDIFCIVKKGLKSDIMNEMNEYDPNLTLTLESMVDNK